MIKNLYRFSIKILNAGTYFFKPFINSFQSLKDKINPGGRIYFRVVLRFQYQK